MKLRNYESSEMQLILISLIYLNLIQILRIQSWGFRFWMISRSPNFWSKSFLQVEHSFIITYFFLLPSFFLLFELYFFVFLHCVSLSFSRLHYILIIIAFIPRPIKKIRFPLFLHVLDRCFKTSNRKNLTQVDCPFQITSASFPNNFSVLSK